MEESYTGARLGDDDSISLDFVKKARLLRLLACVAAVLRSAAPARAARRCR